MLTLISSEELKSIIEISGQAIRTFLSQANANEFKDEARESILAYQANPLNFSDEKLLSFGANSLEALNHAVRIEVRYSAGAVAQVVAKGIWGPKREQFAEAITQKCQQLHLNLQLKLAGSSSLEFNVKGIDKSIPIHFLQSSFDEVLKEMNYQPGTDIDSRQTKTIVAADGDSTIYDGPKVGVMPTLAESPVRDVLCDYLKAGGVFMLVSGNDLTRSLKRVLDALPQEVYCRILVSTNGGAELVYINQQGEAVPVSGYQQQTPNKHRQNLDMVYIGNDGSKEGNDYPAFKAIGFEHSVLVAKEFLPEYDPALKPSYVGGLLQGTRKYLEDFLAARVNRDKKSSGISKSDSWKMFNSIAGRYDFLNRLLSLGQDVRWRKALRQFLPDGRDLTILDLATGTADVLIVLAKDNPKVIRGFGVDPAVKMLEIGRKKIKLAHLDDRLILQQGDGQALPFLDDTFDCVTISFGIRNIPDLRLALLEMYRVTKPGGNVLILEFSKPENPLLKAGHWLYLQTMVPLVGFLFSGNFKAYAYLNQTIQSFPYAERFCKILKQMGFVDIKPHPLMAGAATIYVAQK